LATKKTLEKGTQKEIKYSSTVQVIPKISLRPDLGCFVQFTGDFNGLMIMNFSADSALELYRNYMLTMGLPEEDLAKNSTSSEVVDTMGELTNQIMGRAMRMVETKYDLVSKFGQPKSLFLNSAIILSLETTTAGVEMSPDTQFGYNRRIVFKIGNHRFHVELAMERTEFTTFK
jgi:CheY-specific phosphatase CheX